MEHYRRPGSSSLRSSLLLTALIASLTLPTLNAPAQAPVVTATLTGSNGSSTINITSNQSFTLTLTITTNFVSSGITYFLQVNAVGSGFFRIDGRDASGSPYPTPPLVCSGPGDPCLLNPVSGIDLGASNNGSDTDPAGTYTIATFTITALNAPVGQYTISTDRGIVTDRTGGGFEDRAFSAAATINVVPEPGTVGLGLLGGFVLALMRWRRKRTRA
jgi:hypothetical protein